MVGVTPNIAEQKRVLCSRMFKAVQDCSMQHARDIASCCSPFGNGDGLFLWFAINFRSAARPRATVLGQIFD